MERGGHGAEPPRRSLARPALVLRAGAAALAGVSLTLGGLVLGALAEPSALPPAAAEASSDGALVAEGEVARISASGEPPVTRVYLRGADSLEFRLATDLTGAYHPGDFVVIRGEKRGGAVEAQAIRHATDPAPASAPYLAFGAVVAGCIAVDFVLVRRGAAPRARPWLALRLPLPRRGAGPGEDSRVGVRGDDNHSGAPAPKG